MPDTVTPAAEVPVIHNEPAVETVVPSASDTYTLTYAGNQPYEVGGNVVSVEHVTRSGIELTIVTRRRDGAPPADESLNAAPPEPTLEEYAAEAKAFQAAAVSPEDAESRLSEGQCRWSVQLQGQPAKIVGAPDHDQIGPAVARAKYQAYFGITNVGINTWSGPARAHS